MSEYTILEQLARDARRLRLAVKLPAVGAVPIDQATMVRDGFRELIDVTQLDLPAVSAAMGPGFSVTKLSDFMTCGDLTRYRGDLDRITRGVNQFMETLARRAEDRRPEGWVETEVARKMLLVVAKTVELQAIGLIVGDAGRGKSMALEAASSIHPGSILVSVMRPTRTAAGFAKHLARSMQLTGASTTHGAVFAVVEALNGTGRPLLIDEGHKLTADALDLIRDLHDQCGIPIVLTGTVKLAEQVDDSDYFYGQFASRVALRYNIADDLTTAGGDPRPLYSVDEIRQLYEADKVRFTADARALLTRIANLPGLGGLRLCSKIVQVATAASRGELIAADLIHRVVRMLHGRDHGVQRIERALTDRRAARVA